MLLPMLAIKLADQRGFNVKARQFIQRDVFSPVPLQGNGLAVVVDAQGVTDEQMQRLAAWIGGQVHMVLEGQVHI